MNKQISRRDFLKALGLGTGAVALAACAAPTATEAPAATAVPATEAATAAPVATPLFGYDFAKNKEQWAKLPGDHKFGSLISQADWYAMLGDAPAEPLELALFKGGFGDGWGDIFTKLMEQIGRAHV